MGGRPLPHHPPAPPTANTLSLDQLRERYPRTAERFRASRHWRPFKEDDIARQLAAFFDVDCNYLFHYDDVVELPKRPDSEALGVSLDYLVGNSEVLLDKDLIKRITEIQQLSEADRQGIFFALDGLLRDAKARKAYA